MSWTGFSTIEGIVPFTSRNTGLIKFLTSNDSDLDAFTKFTRARKGFVSDELEVHLWNNGTETIRSVKLLLPPYIEIKDLRNGKWLEVKSNGVINLDNIPMIDDGMTQFIGMGGNDSIFGFTYNTDGFGSDESVSIGDIPANCARILTFRFNIPEAETVTGLKRFGIYIAYLTDETPPEFIVPPESVTKEFAPTPVNNEVAFATSKIDFTFSSYNIYRYLRGVGNPIEFVINSPFWLFLDSNLESTSDYAYAILPVDVERIEGNPLDLFVMDSAVSSATGKILLNWTFFNLGAESPNIVNRYFYIFRASKNLSTQSLGAVGDNEFLDTGLVANTQYWYAICYVTVFADGSITRVNIKSLGGSVTATPSN